MSSDTIDLVVAARARSLGGGISVRRALPVAARPMVGPVIFFDHFGPLQLPAGQGMDVRPHPHIGLATVTYLYDGAIVHRDSLGSLQTITPGDVNWMTAGRGIVHSERSGADERARGPRLHGLQLWVALPLADEEAEPSFHHHPGATLPQLEGEGAYVVEGSVVSDGVTLQAGDLAVYRPDVMATAQAAGAAARVTLLGGAPLDGDRHIDWNFVSSRPERIARARRDWKDGRFPKVPGDETEFIPLPET